MIIIQVPQMDINCVLMKYYIAFFFSILETFRLLKSSSQLLWMFNHLHLDIIF